MNGGYNFEGKIKINDWSNAAINIEYAQDVWLLDIL